MRSSAELSVDDNSRAVPKVDAMIAVSHTFLRLFDGPDTICTLDPLMLLQPLALLSRGCLHQVCDTPRWWVPSTLYIWTWISSRSDMRLHRTCHWSSRLCATWMSFVSRNLFQPLTSAGVAWPSVTKNTISSCERSRSMTLL